jgi:hypothetical protein
MTAEGVSVSGSLVRFAAGGGEPEQEQTPPAPVSGRCSGKLHAGIDRSQGRQGVVPSAAHLAR